MERSNDVRSQLVSRMPVTERHVDLAGVPTAILEGGHGPPLVLLHGQGEFAATWMRVIEDLVRRHRVVVPDLPGHGASAIGGQRPAGEQVFAWVDELITSTCETPPVIVGHLLGGAIAARYALRSPERVQQLVLVDSLGLRWYRPRMAFAVPMVRFVIRPTDRTRDRLFDRCFADYDGLRDEMGSDMELLEAYALERARSRELKVALRAMLPTLGIPPIRGLDAVQVPVALIWGRSDLQTPLATARTAAARLGWPLHVIEGAADDPAHEQPKAFLTALEQVLGGADRREERSTA